MEGRSGSVEASWVTVTVGAQHKRDHVRQAVTAGQMLQPGMVEYFRIIHMPPLPPPPLHTEYISCLTSPSPTDSGAEVLTPS